MSGGYVHAVAASISRVRAPILCPQQRTGASLAALPPYQFWGGTLLHLGMPRQQVGRYSWDRKGGASWAAPLSVSNVSATSIIPISRRSSCGEIPIIDVNMPRLLAAATVQRGHSPAGGSRVHGALNFLVDPQRPADQVPAIWRPEDNPSVVILAAPDRTGSPFPDIVGASTKLVDRETGTGRHLVLETRHGRHRLLVTRSDAAPSYLLPADATAAIRLVATCAFHSVNAGDGSPSERPPLRPSPYQRHRLALLLAILDRIDDDGRELPTLRDLARDVVFPGLDGGSAIAWKTSSHRRQVQRLASEARRMALVGFRELLRHGDRRAPPDPSCDIPGA